ncbi:MAG TPA: PAS domain-containing protein [Pseudolabrys sp.]|nr:PAS domain-containing protein [Pseudolabrys sp.]
MKHVSSQAVYTYWNEKRGMRPAPERGDIDPADIRQALGDTVMLAADFVERWRFRLAGTRVCALFNREIKGEALTALWGEEDQNSIETLAATLTKEQVGAVMGLTGLAGDGATVDLEMLLLPLAHAGHARIRAIGVLAPLSAPYWLGSKPVVELHLTALRHIGPEMDAFAASPALAPAQTTARLPFGRPKTLSAKASPTALLEGGRMRRGLMVYSGGREDLPDPETN